MLKLISSICAAIALALAAAGAAGAGEWSTPNASYAPGTAPRDALFLPVASKPCCYNNGEYFYSTSKTCRRYGGRVVQFEYCQRAYYGPWQDGGHGYRGSDKPCCYSDGQYFHSTSQTCRRFGGRVVAYDYCRRQYPDGYGRDDGYDDDYYDDGYGQGAGSNKPCCYNNGQYFHTSPSTCRRYGGQTVPYEYCTRRRW